MIFEIWCPPAPCKLQMTTSFTTWTSPLSSVTCCCTWLNSGPPESKLSSTKQRKATTVTAKITHCWCHSRAQQSNLCAHCVLYLCICPTTDTSNLSTFEGEQTGKQPLVDRTWLLGYTVVLEPRLYDALDITTHFCKAQLLSPKLPFLYDYDARSCNIENLRFVIFKR